MAEKAGSMSDEAKIPEGYILVPIKATKEMIDAAYWSATGEEAEEVWNDMIEVVRKQTGQ